MKNNLITEIKHIKHLMGINEVSNVDCEIKLEKAGYKVLDKKEQEGIGDDCEEKPSIKCVKDVLDSKMDSSLEGSYEINKRGNRCYVYYSSKEYSLTSNSGETLKHPKNNWVFFDNGSVSFIKSFSSPQTGSDSNNPKEYVQVEYIGKWVCESGDITISELKYRGVYEFGNYDKLKDPNVFNIIKLDGTDSGYPVNRLAPLTGTIGIDYPI